jgi:hypothetical protein
LLEVNGLLPAVVLPTGDVDVTFRYRPMTFYVGLGVSAITLLIGLAIVAIARRRGNKVPAAPEPV